MYSGLCVLLVVLATANAASVQSQWYKPCTQVSWGTQKGVKHKEQAVELWPSERDWKVTIPIPPQCKKENGMVATVCDYDVEPDAKFMDKTHLYVHRNGDLGEEATVQVTVYCDHY